MATYFSDTQTRPGAGMLAAAAAARLGDGQRGGDATTNAPCARVADLLGEEAAVLPPSGAGAMRSPSACRADRAGK